MTSTNSLVKPKQKKRGMDKMGTVWITKPSQTTFFENYTKIKQIGEAGSFGKAFQIERKKDGKILAVKELSKARIYRLHPSDNVRQSLLKSMEAEITIMRRLKHKYIVNMEETYETKHTLHIVMEECRGGELYDRIKEKKRYNEKDARPIIKMVCQALFYMHDKHRVAHLDLKPDNILFVSNDENSPIKIIDFGMSKILPRLRSLQQLCGTPYYTSPEIIRGKYSHCADMWSVGVITFVMIFGFPPFYVTPNKYYGIKETKAIYKLILKGFDPTIKVGYGNWFPKSLAHNVSENGMDFISHLMERDVAKRLTAKEALQHPWLTHAQLDNEITDSDSEFCDAKQQITDLDAAPFANFCISHKFKYAMAGLFREQYKNMRPKHFENLKHLFRELDTDGNGKISYQEFEEGMLKCNGLKLNKNKIGKMFAELDIYGSGEIAFESLLDAFVHDYLIESDVRLYEAFRELDEKESGKIQLGTLKKKIREINVYGNIDDILSIVDDVDSDKDGCIDYQEFLRALHPDFNETPNWFWPSKHDDDDGDEGEDESKDHSSVIEYDEGEDESEEEEEEKKQDMNELIIKQGWMRKEGKIIRSWRKRYFKLQTNGIMSYYHDVNEQFAIAAFNVKKLTKLSNKSWSKSITKRYGIKVYTPHRNWKFLCKNNKERAEWTKAIENISGFNVVTNQSRSK